MDARTRLDSSTIVLSTAPRNLLGASTAHLGYLEALGALGAKTYQVNMGPVLKAANTVRQGGPSMLDLEPIHSDAYPRSELAGQYAVAEMICSLARAFKFSGGSRIILLGTYLFPFCFTIVHAATLLAASGLRPKVVLVPAGSDIWQIGHELQETTRSLLSNPLVTARVSYSARFCREIEAQFGADLEMRVIRPTVDVKHYRPFPKRRQRTLRRRLGIREDDFVMVSCSNMRPVKELGLTLSITRLLSEKLHRNITLILVGPVTPHLISRLSEIKMQVDGRIPQVLTAGKLQVVLVGLRREPRPYYWAADLAINTSLHDSFNISLAEAMACGLPILSTNVVGLRELPDIDDAGLFFPLASTDLVHLRSGEPCSSPIAANLDRIFDWSEELLSDRHEFHRRSAIARSIVEKTLTRSAIALEWYRLICEMAP